ncbi:MAG: N-acetylmuramoyl-L-alanine amidase [Actinomycetia bacterium]|nr:N-acetylmuramoyl-L-alanine amidase [Actinomycetes bacterium]
MLLRRGDEGTAVAEVRATLAALGLLGNSVADDAARFDASTELAIRHFQQRRGLSADGVVGAETYAALTAARWRLGDRVLGFHPAAAMVGDDVMALQVQLLEMGYDVARPDGVFGARTDAQLRSFQHDRGLVPDGVCGPVTLRALRQLGRRVVGGRPQLLRELAAFSAAGPNLSGKRIVVNPGHGGADPGHQWGDVCEANLTWDLATRLEGRLAAVGVTSWLTRGPDSGPSDEQRAEFANDIGADLMLSLHVDGAPSPRAEGLACYYYGGGHDSASTIGERFADLIQREVVARTGMLDDRVHGKTWGILRLTRMPAVQVEVGYLTSPADRARLADPSFRDAVAEGLLVAVQRLYLAKADDPPTGVMRIPAIVG